MKHYLVAIDQSTSASKAYLIDENGNIVRSAYQYHRQFYPAPGYVEHDAEEIYGNVLAVLHDVSRYVEHRSIAAIAITNQRETAVLWERSSGRPVSRAIVWQDVRGEEVCQRLSSNADEIHKITGLPLSPYFAASKLAALFDEKPELRRRAANGELCFGTIDSYLVFRLGGGRHVTDTTNASRTQLLDLHSLQWSQYLCDVFSLPMTLLPEHILPADGCFGVWQGVSITGVLGDSHAALFGQGCHQAGMAKATYGTGSSIMLNTGVIPIFARGGLSTSVAFTVQGTTYYALEGNIVCCGDALRWLTDELQLFQDPNEIERFARSVMTGDGVTFVPAFSGLGTPYYDSSARALICGMNRGTTRAHIAYAALEAIAQQDADVLEWMMHEYGRKLERLLVDGSPTKNALLMQIQADLSGCTIQCASNSELSALGAAYIAGIKTGVFRSFGEIPALQSEQKEFVPAIDDVTRSNNRKRWKTAIERARNLTYDAVE